MGSGGSASRPDTGPGSAAFLASAGSRLVGTIDLDAAASLVVELAVPTLADCAVLVLPDIRGRLDWWRWTRLGRCTRGRIRRPSPESAPVLHAALLGKPPAPMTRAELAGLPHAFADPILRHPVVTAIPLPPGGSGALLLAGRSSEVDLAQEFAGLAGRGLAAARRFERQQTASSQLLSTLRPPTLPVVPGIRMAAIYRPAAGPVDVGGDFYDLHPNSDGSTLFVLGDVCGNGPEAAALSGRFRQSLAALRLVEADPMPLLRLLNQAMLGAGASKFATLVLGTVRKRGGGTLLVRLSSGGHPSPLVLRKDGVVDVAAVPGMLVGIMPGAQFGESTVELAPHDTFVVYTDGITEARGGDEELFGSERLSAVLGGCAGLPVEQVAGRIDEAVQRWTGGHSRDDIALLAIQNAPGQ